MMRRDRFTMLLSLVGVAAGASIVFLHQPPPRSSREVPSSSREPEVSWSAETARPVNLAADPDDAACAISADEIKAWHPSGDFLVVDSRPRREFERIRIPGSVNFPVSDLKTKLYLKERQLLLVDRGYLGHEAMAACRALRDAGFGRLRVLVGGLEAWRQHLGALAGERLAEAALDRIPPRAFDAGLRRGKWIVVDVSDAPETSGGELSSAVAHVPFGKDGSGFATRLRTAVAAQSGQADPVVVIVDRDGARYPAIDRVLGADRPGSLYFLEGGLDDYHRYRTQQQAMLARAIVAGCEQGCSGR